MKPITAAEMRELTDCINRQEVSDDELFEKILAEAESGLLRLLYLTTAQFDTLKSLGYTIERIDQGSDPEHWLIKW